MSVIDRDPPPPTPAGARPSSQPAAETQRVSRAENRVLWRIARREMRFNLGRTALVVGITLFGMLSCAFGFIFVSGWGIPSGEGRWFAPLVFVARSLPNLLIALLPTMLIVAAGFSASTKRRAAEYQRLRSIGAQDRQILRLVSFEALVPALLTVVIAGVALLLVDALFGATVPVPSPAIGVALYGLCGIATITAITIAARIPARSVVANSNQSVMSTDRRVGTPARPDHKRRVPGPIAMLVAAGLLLVIYLLLIDWFFASWLLILMVLLVFAAVVQLVDPLVGLVGRLAPRLSGAGRFAVRDASRNRTRSVGLIGAGIGITTLAVMATAGLLSDVGEHGLPMDDRFIVGPANGPTGESFLQTVRTTVSVDHEATIEVVGHPTDYFAMVLIQSDNHRTMREQAPVAIYSEALADALALPDDVRQAAAVGQIVLLATSRVDALRFNRPIQVGEVSLGRDPLDLDFVHHPTGNLGSSFLDANFTNRGHPVLPAALIPPGLAEELDLGREPSKDELLVVASAPLTDDDKAAIARGDTVHFSPDGTKAHEFIRAAAAAAGLFGVVLGLLAAGMAGSESHGEISTMVSAGARPSIRRRMLAIQAWIHLTIAGVLGSVLGVIMFWAVTRGDPTVPDPIFPWLTMAVMVLVVPSVTAVLVALGFRSAKPKVSRRAEV